jgi:hypothetical protein
MRFGVEQVGMWKRLCLLLWMLPFVFTSAFGEAMHSHPFLLSQDSVLVAKSALADEHAAHESETAELHSAACPKLVTECLACLWASQTAQSTPPLVALSVREIVARRFHPAQTPYCSPLLASCRNRGPPVS